MNEHFYPNRITRRRFIKSVGAGAVATAAVAGGVVTPVQAANVIPADRFGRMFPTLPKFAAQTKKMEQALMELGKKGGPHPRHAVRAGRAGAAGADGQPAHALFRPR